MKPPEICPNCGAAVPPNARACPQCGSDEETGWSEDAAAAGLDLPGQEFNYDEYVKREFGGEGPKPRGIPWFWWVIALGLIVLFALLMVR